MTKGWTGADIEGLVNEANSLAFARKLEAYESDESEEYTESKYDYSEIGKIRMSDFTEAINLIKPKKDEAILSYYT
jgi:SpoVK/Ycf46/Vps4 family AAA+-type ATPase